MKFIFTARQPGGGVLRDVIEADSRQEALAKLRTRGLTTVSLHDDLTQSAESSAPAKKSRNPNRKDFRHRKVRIGDTAIFCRQLAVSINSGLPLRDALEGIHEDMDVPVLKAVVKDLIERLHDGSSFSDAVARHPAVFSRIFIGLVRAAEESGTLGTTLDRLASYIEEAEKLRRKIRSMMAYPAFVAIFFVIITAVMVLFVLPRFENIFGSLGAELPTFTKGVFRINNFMIHNLPFVLLGIVLLVFVYRMYSRTPNGRRRVDELKLKIPYAGNCLRKYIIARFCRSLAIMTRSGVPVASALEITAAVAANQLIESAVMLARNRIISGSGIANSLEQMQVFPNLLIRMISVGESAGKLPEVLDRVADVYEDQVEASIVTATSLLEPVIITVFGLMVLLLVLSIYLPVFTVSSKIR